MNLNQKPQILTRTLFITSLINLVFAIINSAVRLIMNVDGSVIPDMLNESYWYFQVVLFILQTIMTVIVFVQGFHIAKREQITPTENAFMLLKIWAAVLVGVKLIYNLSSILYRHFIEELLGLVAPSDTEAMRAFSVLYVNTHSLKYVGILLAIALGIFVTGTLYHDRPLQIASVILVIIYFTASSFLQMAEITVLDRPLAIVWASVIFHVLQTVGLMAMSGYLYKKNYV